MANHIRNVNRITRADIRNMVRGYLGKNVSEVNIEPYAGNALIIRAATPNDRTRFSTRLGPAYSLIERDDSSIA